MIAEETRTNRADCRREPTARARRVWFKGSIVLLSQVLAAGAWAQEGVQAPSLPEPAGDDEAPRSAPAGSNQVLEERIAELTERLNRAEEEMQKSSVSPLTWNGYVDFGFFAPIGNHGVGWVRDFGNMQFPQYSDFSWTFLGDILGSPVNTRGEAADLGDATGISRFDSVHSRGAGGFIVNEVNLRPRYAITENAIARASINFVPRTGGDFALGDFIDVDLAELEYVLTRDGKTSIFAGKMMPVFGIEYKERKSDQRYGITPSLIARYTTGSQLGLKIRSKLLDDWLVLAGAVTNNSSVWEMFHFSEEVDSNWGKTLNGRAAVSVPVGSLYGRDDRLEIGFSGEWGPQDRALNNGGKIWFAGVDLQFQGAGYALRAQVMEGGAPGRGVDGAWGLDLKPSGYVQADWQIFSRFGIYGRVDLRDAVVTLDATDQSRIYLTKQVRYTGGVHITFTPHVVLKAEYFHNDEYGGIKDFRNDMFTSSLLLQF